MRLKTIYIFLAFQIIANKALSQKENTLHYKHIVHLEAAGIGGYGSLNFERIIKLNELFSLSARIGFSTNRIYDYNNKFNPDLLFPIAINGFFGKVHKVQLGLGQLVAFSIKANILNGPPARETNFHTNFTLGYRYQKQDSRIISGISYTPILEYNSSIRHWGAFTIGYLF
jgi:hypothetical protein